LLNSVQETSVSIIIPVRDFAAGLGACVAAAMAQDPPALEVLVSDDGSVDGSGDIARAHGASVARSETSKGAAEARNAGARRARGDILLFLDADVVAPPDTLGRVARMLSEPAGPVAVFGSYDAEPPAPGQVSQFRNLLHHYTHQHAAPEATTFWAGCGAIRRDIFESLGGFSSEWNGIEDIELGYRLRTGDHRVRLDRDLQVTHLKRWTLRSMLSTDFSLRALQWSRLIRSRDFAPDDLNVSTSQRISVVLSAVAAMAFAAAILEPWALIIALVALSGLIVLNRDLYRFLAESRGVWFAICSLPLHFCYFVTAGLGYACALAEGWFSPRPARIDR